MNLRDLIDRYLAATTAGYMNETYTSYRRKLNYLVNFVGGDQVDANTITGQTIEGLKLFLSSRDKKRKGSTVVSGKLSPMTIHTALKTVKHFLDWSYRNGHLNHDAMQGVKLPKEPQPKPKAVSQENIVKLLQAAAQNGQDWERVRNVALIMVLCDTGARVSGIANAELADLDLSGGEMLVVEKGDNQRTVFLSPGTVEALRTWLDWRGSLAPIESTLFIGRYGTRLTRKGIYQVLAAAAKRGDVVGRFNPHSFRHSFAKGAIENGIDLSRLADLLGHSSEAITAKYYTRWNNSELRRAHQRFSPGVGLPDIRPELTGRPAGRASVGAAAYD